MIKYLFGCVSKGRTCSQIGKRSCFCIFLHLRQQIGTLPVFMDETNRLSGTFLANCSVCILITLPSNIVNMCDVWTNNLPVKSGVFNFHLRITSEAISSNSSQNSIIKRIFTFPFVARLKCSATLELPVNCVTRRGDFTMSSSTTGPRQFKRSRSFGSIPQCIRRRTNCSITTDTCSLGLRTGLLPMYRAPISCKTGISSGKLKGVTNPTGPYGQR
mmetsp:Transcript_19914/g.48893  ORF Transcript_19914/g.48893 Transcript_19914/m.48893 type:complete len:216 (-) Transcript_19914:602-1249(-)